MDKENKYIMYFKNGKSLAMNQVMANKLAFALDKGTKFITIRNENEDVHTVINTEEVSHLTNI